MRLLKVKTGRNGRVVSEIHFLLSEKVFLNGSRLSDFKREKFNLLSETFFQKEVA